MTCAEFAALIERTGWTGREVARRFGIPRSNIAAMTSGANSVDETLARYLQRVALAIERVDMPDLADRRFREED